MFSFQCIVDPTLTVPLILGRRSIVTILALLTGSMLLALGCQGQIQDCTLCVAMLNYRGKSNQGTCISFFSNVLCDSWSNTIIDLKNKTTTTTILHNLQGSVQNENVSLLFKTFSTVSRRLQKSIKPNTGSSMGGILHSYTGHMPQKSLLY